MDPQPDKMVEAVIYLCQLSVDDPNLDNNKLVKLLYHADGEAYQQRGATITGATYLHFPNGPLPEGWHRIRKRMEQKGDATVLYDQARPGYADYRLIANRQADLELLSPTDCQHLAQQVKRFAEYNTAGITQYAREEVAWLSTEDGEPMEWNLHGVVSVH